MYWIIHISWYVSTIIDNFEMIWSDLKSWPVIYFKLLYVTTNSWIQTLKSRDLTMLRKWLSERYINKSIERQNCTYAFSRKRHELKILMWNWVDITLRGLILCFKRANTSVECAFNVYLFFFNSAIWICMFLISVND